MKTISETNWDYVDSLTDDQIDYSDIPPLRDDFFNNATLRMPEGRKMVLVDVDIDTFAFFESQGDNKRKSIIEALSKYALEHQPIQRTA